MLESLHAFLLGPFDPLAERTLAHTQSAGYILLLAALLLELPGT